MLTNYHQVPLYVGLGTYTYFCWKFLENLKPTQEDLQTFTGILADGVFLVDVSCVRDFITLKITSFSFEISSVLQFEF